MNLLNILVFTVFALVFSMSIPRTWRKWALLGGSVLAVYWMQPSTPIRNLDFWFPTASIALTVFVWVATRPPGQGSNRRTFIAAAFLSGVVLLIGLTRYIDLLCCLTPTRPPEIQRVILVLVLVAAAVLIPYFLLPKKRFLPAFTILIILALFIILKTDALARSASALFRIGSGQSFEFASSLDLPWLGFSFLAFRLLHVLRDYQSGKLPDYNLVDFVTYGIFFPAYTAGPIDRSQHFVGNLNQVTASGGKEELPVNPSGRFAGGTRIITGVFKKFVVADSLAVFALNGQNALQVNETVWAWVLLYAYSFRIYFDFSGYTDIALGLAEVMGFKLPENFDRPYRKLNLTSFWNSWHITLAQWFRAYYFNPVTRYLRSKVKKLPGWGIIFIGQFTTMLLIGLWHGITWNFAIWGAWHGLGLFINNRWSAWLRPRLEGRSPSPGVAGALKFSSWLVTFNFVSLGWVWFALPTPPTAFHFFKQLFSM